MATIRLGFSLGFMTGPIVGSVMGGVLGLRLAAVGLAVQATLTRRPALLH